MAPMDYDGGAVGAIVREACRNLRGPKLPMQSYSALPSAAGCRSRYSVYWKVSRTGLKATRASLDKLQGTLKRCSELFRPTRHFEIPCNPGIRYEVRFIASGAGRTREDQGSGLWSSTLPSGCTGESDDSGG